MENQVKVCADCKVEKNVSEFAPTKQQLKFGVKSRCRDCEREYRREWVKRNPVRQRDQVNGWKATNREKIRAANREYAARIRKEKPEQLAVYNRRAMLKRNYGVTQEWYEKQKAEQNNRCAICDGPPPAKGLSIDHCHKTGKTCELLCTMCNTSIHKLETHLDWVAKAEAYLRKHGRWPHEDLDPPSSRSHEALWREHLR